MLVDHLANRERGGLQALLDEMLLGNSFRLAVENTYGAPADDLWLAHLTQLEDAGSPARF